jgi:hypothetical protein
MSTVHKLERRLKRARKLAKTARAHEDAEAKAQAEQQAEQERLSNMTISELRHEHAMRNLEMKLGPKVTLQHYSGRKR